MSSLKIDPDSGMITVMDSKALDRDVDEASPVIYVTVSDGGKKNFLHFFVPLEYTLLWEKCTKPKN